MLYVEIPYGITEAERIVTPDAVGIPYFNRNHYIALPTTDALLSHKTLDDRDLLKYFPSNVQDSHNYSPAFRSIALFTSIPNSNYEYLSKDGTTLFYVGVDKIYFDIDTQSVLESQISARRLIKWLNSIGIFTYRIFFSGSKGFHISLNVEDIYGEYRYLSSDTLKELVAVYVSSLSGVKLDTSIYSNRSIIRLPNTINIKTRLFKIEITEQELMGDIGDIELLAVSRRDPVDSTSSRSSDYTLLKNMLTLAEDLVEHKLHSRSEFVTELDGTIEPIDFMEEFIENKQLKPGTRHEVSLTLASYFRAIGLSIDEAEERMTTFMTYATGSSTPVPQRLRESRNDIKTCYMKHIRFSKLKALEVLA